MVNYVTNFDILGNNVIIKDPSAIHVVDTFNDILRIEVKVGDIIMTRGYYNINDSGASWYFISDTDVGISTPYNDLFICYVQKRANARQLGLTGNVNDDVTDLFSKACNFLDVLELMKGDTYLINNANITSNITLIGNGAILTKNTTDIILSIVSETIKIVDIQNVTFDGRNYTAGYSHLITINGSLIDVNIDNCQFINNLQLSGNVPVQNCNADALNVQKAKSLTVTNCTFNNISRNGIAITDQINVINIDRNNFNNCYLCGIDIEPNTTFNHMYNSVIIINNYIDNCGRHDNGYVFNSGGPLFIQSGSSQETILINKLLIENNVLKSSSYYTHVSGQTAPYIRIQQYSVGNINNNYFENLNRVLIAPSGTGIYLSTSIIGNYAHYTNPINMNIFIQQNTNYVVIVGNSIKGTLNLATGNANVKNDLNNIVA